MYHAQLTELVRLMLLASTINKTKPSVSNHTHVLISFFVYSPKSPFWVTSLILYYFPLDSISPPSAKLLSFLVNHSALPLLCFTSLLIQLQICVLQVGSLFHLFRLSWQSGDSFSCPQNFTLPSFL
ncbi:hypothetical protein RJT34_14478 [Clitoria ternatea]|uniref:Uncharacterized protein n=1 Tax=Clitoria ternatea TaxID=43366 RepID=A0AAN9JSP8_CLITE